MPELPEVETVRSRLEPVLVGRTLADVEILDGRLTRPVDPAVVATELIGERIAAVERRGKYLIVRFETGRVLLIHLRMTGNLLLAGRGTGDEGLPEDPHRHAVVRLDDGSDVVYRDVRRFGTWLLLEPGELEPYLATRLGHEPLSPALTARELGKQVAGRRAPVKALLLDQRVLAGVGNIYADEGLWYAQVHPRTPGGDLTPEQLKAIRRGIRRALELGIARQGSTIGDYRQPDGSRGQMQDEFRAYDRAGEPCRRCGTPIEKTRVAGRGTYFCPACQR